FRAPPSLLDIGYERDEVRPEYAGADDGRLREVERDGGGRPSGDGAIMGHDEELDGALVTGAEASHVHGPREPFSVVPSELCFNDNTEHWPSVDQEHDGVGAVLGRDDFGEIGGSETSFRVRRQLEMKRLAEELGSELRMIAEEQDERLVVERRHRRGRYP
ncbi:MAG TPA: hypothetical protein VF395_13500, partial [Polyangiaceae bacterium]